MPIASGLKSIGTSIRNNISRFTRSKSPPRGGQSSNSAPSGRNSSKGQRTSSSATRRPVNQRGSSRFQQPWNQQRSSPGKRLSYRPYGSSGSSSNPYVNPNPTPKGVNVNINTRGTTAIAKGVGGTAAVKTTVSGSAKFLLKFNPLTVLLVTAADFFLNPSSVADSTVPEYLRQPGEQQITEEAPPPPPYGSVITFYSTNNFRTITWAVKSYEVIPTGEVPYAHRIDTVGIDDIERSTNLDPSTLTSKPLDYPEGTEPESTSPSTTQSTIDYSTVPTPERASENNPSPQIIRKPASNKKAAKTPASIDNPRKLPKSKLNSPIEIPEAILKPKPAPEKTIEEIEQPTAKPKPEIEIISKRYEKGADGTTRTITERFATAEESQLIKNRTKNALDVIEQDKQFREFKRNHAPFDRDVDVVKKNRFLDNDRVIVETTTKTPTTGKVTSPSLIPPSSGTTNIGNENPIDPPEPDRKENIIPAIPAPIKQNDTTECKGCNKKILGKLDGLNLAGQAADLALVKEIHSTVHNATHGLQAIQKFAEKAWKFTKADKIINGLGTIASIHNAAMLSQDVSQTLGDTASSALDLFGIKNAEGEGIDVNQAIGGAIKSKINSIFPESTTTAVTSVWLGLNRIHQAVGSTVSAIQGTKNALLEADEITGGHIAQIGNALQDQSIIEEDSYDFMNPEPDYKTPFKGILGRIEDIENVAERVSSIVSTGLEIKETSTELVTTSDELTKATEDFLKGFETERNTKVIESESPAIDRLDLLKKELDEEE